MKQGFAGGMARGLWASVAGGKKPYHLEGLDDTAEVLWDAAGVPHVRAASRKDLFFAQGFVQASRRLFQMDFIRRLASGRLAEVLGDRPVPWEATTRRAKGHSMAEFDFYMRLFGMEQAAVASEAILSRDAQASLQAYAAGVNAFIASMDWRTKPLELSLLRYTPEPWRPADCILVLKAMAFQMGFGMRHKLFLAAAAEVLKDEPALLASLVPPAAGDEVPRMVQWLGGSPQGSAELLAGDEAVRRFAGWANPRAGSNWLIVGPERSESGKPIVANDPHLDLRQPNLLFINALETPDLSLAGASIVGHPGVAFGHNAHYAWAITVVMADDADVYFEELVPDQPGCYRDADGVHPFETRVEQIRVKGESAPRERTVRLTRRGPVLSDAFASTAPWGADTAVLSLQWTAAKATRDSEAALRLNAASSWEQFREAASLITAPALNLGYADVDGHIGYQLAGEIPRRSNVAPGMVARAAAGEAIWGEPVPFDQLPHVLDPECGYLVSANNQPTDASYPHYISRYCDAPYRVRRLHERVLERPHHSAATLGAAATDVVSAEAKRYIDEVLRPIGETLTRHGGLVAEAWGELEAWDCRFTTDHVGPTVFSAWMRALIPLVFAPKLGAELVEVLRESWHGHGTVIEAVVCNETHAWWGECDRAQVCKQAFVEAVAWLADRWGGEVCSWNWGRVHQLTLRHALDGAPLIGRMLRVGPVPTPGGCTTVNNGQWAQSAPFEHMGGAAVRRVVDLADTSRYWATLCGGQSGDVRSVHYADQLADWCAGRYVERCARAPQPQPGEPGWLRQVLRPENTRASC